MPPKQVLVVAPAPVFRKVERALRAYGARVVGAPRLSDMPEGAWDAALVAVSQPDGDGYEVCRRVRGNSPGASLFLMAGGFDVVDEARADQVGAAGRVRLPFSEDGLRDALVEVLGPLPVELESGAVEILPEPSPPPAAPPRFPAPPISSERLATFLPRDPREAHRPEPVAVDPKVVGPALERAVLEVLPEVVEGVLRTALLSSPAFRELVAEAVHDVLEGRLGELDGSVRVPGASVPGTASGRGAPRS